MKKERYVAIVLAAGRGRRMNSDIQKQYLMLDGYPVLFHTLKAFQNSLVDEIVLVTGTEEISYCKEEIVERYGFTKVVKIVAGGKERYHSVYEGLKAVDEADYVLIHDGARPFVTEDMIARTIKDAKEYGGSVAAMPVKDTIKIADSCGLAANTPDRSLVWMVQTPQTFSYSIVRTAYDRLMERETGGQSVNVTDEAMVVEQFGGCKIKLTEGSYENIKITTPSDLVIAKAFLQK